ncbi:Hint domain-containing protein [Shimia sp.]|uniref:Hint domain-containing protein n=1 Tax=Shimia sp. TaxID=1954381 RepID=UPI003B8E2EC8
MGEFVVFGIDVLNNPNVSTTSGTGNDGQGIAVITGGSQPFEDDDIVVFETVNETPDGELSGSSAIGDITVYDSLADYEAGLVKYNYAPQNPGQTASIQGDVSGLGDAYVRFNANVLVPEDGGPTFGSLFVAPGTNLADAANQPGGLTLDRNQDIDLDGDGDFDEPLEEGNNLFYVGDYTQPIPCFTVGTKLRTPSGPALIETLRPGDQVLTLDNGAQTVRWIGRRRVQARGHMAPVHIAANTYGKHRALEVSQNHRILRKGPEISLLFAEPEVLVAAKHLIDKRNVTLRTGGWVEYVHILFDQHQIVWANGLLSESLYPSVDSFALADPSQEAAMKELQSIFGELFEGETVTPEFAARRCLKKSEASLIPSGSTV